MTKYEVNINIGYGWEPIQYAPLFDTREEALDFIRGDDPTDTTRWDGQMKVFEVEED